MADTPKETSGGLPIVTAKTLTLLKQMFGGKGEWGAHLEAVKARMVKENPYLVKYVENQVGKFPYKSHTPIFELIVGTLAVLEQQAKTDKDENKPVKPRKRLPN
jgi:hypothetical protein